MSKSNTSNIVDTLKARLIKLTPSKGEFEKEVTKARTARRDALGFLLADARVAKASDLQKAIRRQIRRTGHYISEDGKPWLNASRKANVNATPATPVEATRTRTRKAKATPVEATPATPVEATPVENA